MSEFLTAVLAVAAVLGFMILIHEWGHYAAAKLLGVRVEVFSIGFGKRLAGFKRGDTDYRISAIPLAVPPLRERGGDVVLLARRLVERISAEMGRPGVRLSAEAEKEIARHGWPGNVRQLRNVLERAVLLGERTTLEPADLSVPAAPAAATPGGLASMTLAEAERRHIEAVLRAEKGTVPRAAEVLGLSRSALYERIKKHGLVVKKTSGD